MRDPISEPFRTCVKCVCGLTSGEVSGLHSSLPCELCFNDLRDAGKRHSKAERISPQSIHSVAFKSSEKRAMGCKTVSLTSQDWSEPCDKKNIKTNVYNATRATDVSLGVDSTGLTRNPNNIWFTKPHVLTQRLELMQLSVTSNIFTV